MYSCDVSAEHSPHIKSKKVLILENSDKKYFTIKEIVQEAKDLKAVSEDDNGKQIFCYLFEGYPDSIQDSSEKVFCEKIRAWLSQFQKLKL